MLADAAKLRMVGLNDTVHKHKKVKLYSEKASSSYNLFFQYNRIMHRSSETLSKNPTTMYGLEHVDIESSPMLMLASDNEIRAYRKDAIARTLQKHQSNQECATGVSGSNRIKTKCISFSELSKQMGLKWQETDETTKSIFQELAKEISEQRQLSEYEKFKASSARFAVKLPSSPLRSHQVANARDKKSHIHESSTKKSHKQRYVDQVTLKADWTPLPLSQSGDEMDVVEFDWMLSKFDWS